MKKYFAETRREKQLYMLKEYMLSLSPEELKAFVMEPIRFLGDALQSQALSEENKDRIFEKLEELTFLMKRKVAA